ncbi:hypothetical protein RhiirA5_430417 [Rhizophagus irregularis]|uniref:Uncharacterized protein n=1 Tax=Rhizophagus irregularis TaxID=588596 RepID=A0A2N0NWR0_9GLOM|nr:hypothetical protein RhiirA5_430417 [Rhizophagus irregularis]
MEYEEKMNTSKEKIVSPVELHKFAKVNADYTKRLQKGSEQPFTFSKYNPFIVKEEDKSILSTSSEDDDYIKDIKKRTKKKQGARSSDSEEDSILGHPDEVEVEKDSPPTTKNPISGKG